MKGKYFKGFDGLRFLAATLVIFHHVEQYKHWAGLDNAWGTRFVDALGHLPVAFFFVLSGFLITYLLLTEHHNTKSIHVGSFYFRRIIRIWPLYFSISLVSLCLIPILFPVVFPDFAHPLAKPGIIGLLLFFLPNLLRVFHPLFPGGNQLWSVGIEEQFYLVWPLLIRKFIGNMRQFLMAFLVLKLIVHGLLILLIAHSSLPHLVAFEKLYRLFPVEQMGIGGWVAYEVFFRKKPPRIMYQVGIALSLILGFASQFGGLVFLETYLQGILFAMGILWITQNERLAHLLETPWLKKGGQISYGIYMWHTSAIVFTLAGIRYLGWPESIIPYLSFFLTLIMAWSSYKWLETPFLTLRTRAPKTRVLPLAQ